MAMAGLATSAFATNGYFSHGYGMKSKGMAGASTATHDDAFGGANNPAAMAFAGNRLDLGLDVFNPIREFSNTTAGFTVESDSEWFFIPEFGYNRMINNDLALGVTVYGNGGMNSDYPPFPDNSNYFLGTGALGVDLMQLMVAPTAAFKFSPNHSIGIAPLLGYQMFEAQGLDFFGDMGISTSPDSLTNNGHDGAFGWGVRVGYMGKITPTVTIGAAYASKMDFEEFDDYAGLFAEQGDFDVPENWNLGVAWQATPQIKLAMDYQRINYSGVDSISNPSSNLGNCLFGDPTYCLGGDNGPGFGWDDIDVWKLGMEYKHNNAWTFRAGYSHSDNPISSSDVTFNILAPGVVQDHLTLGFTHTLASGDEVTMAYMHAFENSVDGPSLFNALGMEAGNEEIKMNQNSLGIQYSWKM